VLAFSFTIAFVFALVLAFLLALVLAPSLTCVHHFISPSLAFGSYVLAYYLLCLFSVLFPVSALSVVPAPAPAIILAHAIIFSSKKS
jgi:hypothetical protein